jgi:hypothetical protein
MFGTTNEDFFRSLATTSDGGCIAVGETNGWSANYDINVVKLDSSGATQWSKVLGTVLDIDYAWNVKQTSDGGYIIGGNSGAISNTGDILLFKLDANGNVVWSKMIGDGNVSLNDCRSIIETSSGNYLMSGIGGVNDEGLVVMLNNTGDTLWTKHYAVGILVDHIRFINEINPNEFIACGYSSSIGSGSEDIFLLKIDSNGFAGGCNEYSANYNVNSHTLPSITGIPSSSTIFTTGVISGSTTLTYTQTNVCDSILFTSVIESNINMNKDLSVYPNPANENLTITIPNTLGINKQILIYNSMGKLVKEISALQSESINISDLYSGIYFIQLKDKPHVAIKFIKH